MGAPCGAEDACEALDGVFAPNGPEIASAKAFFVDTDKSSDVAIKMDKLFIVLLSTLVNSYEAARNAAGWAATSHNAHLL
jgi:hypothetical protein